MYATHPMDRYSMVKIEQQDRAARAHRRLTAGSNNRSYSQQPSSVRVPNLRRRAAVALATFLLSLGLLAGVAAAQDLSRPSGDGVGSGCVRVVGDRLFC
jgi:hypothetical protein